MNRREGQITQHSPINHLKLRPTFSSRPKLEKTTNDISLDKRLAKLEGKFKILISNVINLFVMASLFLFFLAVFMDQWPVRRTNRQSKRANSYSSR